MATKRSRNHSDDDDEEEELPRKTSRTCPVKSDEILLTVNTFKKDIIKYNKTINRIKYSLDNPDEYIYDECTELRRMVQLETEEMIAKIKQTNEIDVNTDETKLESKLFNLIQNLIEQSQEIIIEIDENEKALKTHWFGKKTNKKLFTKHFDKSYINSFIQNWTDKLDELKFDDQSITEAATKLQEYQSNLNDLMSKVKMYLFNNNCFELRRIDDKQNENRLNYFVYYKEQTIFEKSNHFDLRNILEETTIQKVKDNKNLFYLHDSSSLKILNNGNKLLFFSGFLNSIIHTYIAIYNPVLNRLVNEKLFENHRYDQIYVIQNLIVLRLKSQDETSLVIMNYDFEFVKKISNAKLIGINESFIYIYINDQLENDKEFEIKVVDLLSLEIDKTISIQCINRSEPFFYEFNESKFSFRSIKNFYYLKSRFRDYIYDQNGILIRMIDHSVFKL